jgi:hypothetical protein
VRAVRVSGQGVGVDPIGGAQQPLTEALRGRVKVVTQDRTRDLHVQIVGVPLLRLRAPPWIPILFDIRMERVTL